MFLRRLIKREVDNGARKRDGDGDDANGDTSKCN